MEAQRPRANRRTVVAGMAALAGMGAAPVHAAGAGGGLAPDFTLPARAGGEQSLAGLKGQVVLINFWATWCGPCRKEMPLLEQIWQRYKTLGFTLLAVNVEEDSAGATKWLDESVKVTFPVLFDRENRVSKLYDVTAMPSTVIVDRRGQVRFVHFGYTAGTENAYQDQVRTLIREKA